MIEARSLAVRGAHGRRRLLVILRIVGAVVALAGSLMVPPMALAAWDDDGTLEPFAETLAVCLVVGAGLWLPLRHVVDELRLRDGFLVTTLSWVLISAICSVPFMLGAPRLDFSDAFFESVSGLTTTGATVITGLDALPRSVLLYRQLLQFLGGMGILILAVAILPMLRIGGSQLFRTEITGPTKDTRLTPRIAETAKALWLIYVGLTVLCAAAYWVAGMGWFDAVGHAFSTVSTAGFSTHDASLGHFDSALIEGIAVVFMLLGATNFALHFAAWRRASSQVYFQDAELRAYALLVLGAAALLCAALYGHGVHGDFGSMLRAGVFHAVSLITTTTFVTERVDLWPGLAPMLLVMLPFIGGCGGSTAGGMKAIRVLILYRQGAREVLQLVHPRGRFLVKVGSMSVPGSVLAAVTGFCVLYVTSMLVMALLLAGTGLEFATALSLAAASINNGGVTFGAAATSFAPLGDLATSICSFGMLLGRLEVFTLLVLVTPAFWRE